MDILIYEDKSNGKIWMMNSKNRTSKWAHFNTALCEFKSKEHAIQNGFPWGEDSFPTGGYVQRTQEERQAWVKKMRSNGWRDFQYFGAYIGGKPVNGPPVFATVTPLKEAESALKKELAQDPSAVHDFLAMAKRANAKSPEKKAPVVERPMCPLLMMTPINSWGRPMKGN